MSLESTPSTSHDRSRLLAVAYLLCAIVAVALTIWVYVEQGRRFGVWDFAAHMLLSVVWVVGFPVQFASWWFSPGRTRLTVADTLLRWVAAGIGAFLITMLLASAGWNEYGAPPSDWAVALGNASEALALTPWFHALLVSVFLRWNLPASPDA